LVTQNCIVVDLTVIYHVYIVCFKRHQKTLGLHAVAKLVSIYSAQRQITVEIISKRTK